MPNNKIKKPTLTESIKYEEEMKGHRFVQIYSGVGSGKNYFVERFLEGDEEHGIPKKTVLIITSRKAKVQEVLADSKTTIEAHVRQQWDEYFHLYEDGESYDEDKIRVISSDGGTYRIYQQSVICTNAFIEQYLKYIYCPEDVVTHLWELFDIIIVDEVHSMVMDATYQSAPFYINELINEVELRHKQADENPLICRRPLCEQVIVMTGTNDPLKTLHLPKEHSVVIDRMSTCKNVQPENVRFISLTDAKTQIAKQLATGERIVYFQNHTNLPAEFCEGTAINPNVVVPSFSKDEKRRLLKHENKMLHKRMEKLEESLRKFGVIPQDIKLLLTTGRNKEGINIYDTDIKTMYVESHLFNDIVQMAGRVREGVQDLYVVVDSKGYSYSESKWERLHTKRRIVGNSKDLTAGAANQEFKSLCGKENLQEELFNNRDSLFVVHECEELEEYVDFIHGKYPYTRYSYFDNVFKYYDVKETGLLYQLKSLAEFNRTLENPQECVKKFQELFPDATIHPYYSVDMKAKMTFDRYIPNTNATYDETILIALRDELKRKYYPELNQLQDMLNRFSNLKCVRLSNNKEREGYKKRKFIEVVAKTA